MKKTFTTLLLFTFILLACSKEKPQSVKGNFTNPNGESELAVFMRTMHDETALAKTATLAGEKYDFTFDTTLLFTPNASEPEKVASAAYQAFGTAYLNALQAYQKAGTGELADHYEQLVGACETCHQALCPGPLVRVKKLYL
jgi:hypothetical protein